MPIELFYIAVAFTAGYQGAMILHRAGPAQRTFAYMLLADAMLGGTAYVLHGKESQEQIAGLIGAVAIGGCVCLVLLPLVLRDFSRRLAAREHLGWAIRLAELRELVSPGLGGRQEADVLRVVADVRAGRVEGALALLNAERSRARTPEAQRALKDRILTTLLYVNRWDEAVKAYESEPASATGPAVAAELIRAYGELGRLDRAAEVVGRLEKSAEAKDPLFVLIQARARLLFLAFTGRVVGVSALVSSRGPLAVLPDAARAYWVGTARLYAGDRDGARESLAEAEKAAAGESRWRQLVRERLESTENVAAPSLSPEVSALADHLARLVDEAPPAVEPVTTVAPVRPLVTYGLIAANLGLFALGAWLGNGDTTNVNVLVRLGANVPEAVVAGEYWRLPASTFLHLGFAHVAMNMLSLWMMGRLIEPAFGSLRFFAVYMLAGLGGAVVSMAWAQEARLSVGASGAVLGIVGALLVDVLASRRRGKQRWSRDLLGAILFIVASNVAIGFLHPSIDQKAHVGGLVSGALAALLLSPATTVGAHSVSRALAVLLAIVGATGVAYAAFGAATTTRADTTERMGWERRSLGGVSFEVPRIFYVTDGIVSWGGDLLDVREAGGFAAKNVEDLEKQSGLTAVELVSPSVAAPEGWDVSEIRYVAVGREGNRAYRYLMFRKVEGQVAMFVNLNVAESALPEIATVAPRILASAHLR